MSHRPEHPLVSRKDWQGFSTQLPIYFSKAFAREAADIPFWLLPLCRGVLAAGPYLLRLTAYQDQRHDWVQIKPDVYQRVVGKTRLRVRRTNDGRLWIISRWPVGVKMRSERDSETLVHFFGSTPVVTDNLCGALHLAHWFEVNAAVANIRWTRVSPGDNHDQFYGLASAIRRAAKEGLKITWNDLWASSAHSRRMKRRGCLTKPTALLPPVFVRVATRWARSPHFPE
jgi:hypothetical protein